MAHQFGYRTWRLHAVSLFRPAHLVGGTHLASLEVDDFTHSKIEIGISIRVTKDQRKTETERIVSITGMATWCVCRTRHPATRTKVDTYMESLQRN